MTYAKFDYVDGRSLIYDNVESRIDLYEVATPAIPAGGIIGTRVADNTHSLGLYGVQLRGLYAKGQSFTVSSKAKITQVDLVTSYESVAQNITIRLGDTSDLSTYIEEVVAYGDGIEGSTVSFGFSSGYVLLPGTTYYIAILKSTADKYNIKYNMVDVYPGGAFLYASSIGWNLDASISGYDLNFTVWGMLA